METARQPTLYVIGTPIGNLEDLTPRARRYLGTLTEWVVEDTREARKLLELCGIAPGGKRFHSYAAHNMKEATETAIAILLEGRDMGFLTDRGTPCISDPGALLVARAQELGIRVTPIPGVSSITTALSVCGMNASGFVFKGFPPTQDSKLREFFESIKTSELPICFLESPHRIHATLNRLKSAAPDSIIFIGRELTKQFETLVKLKLRELEIESIPALGEFTLIVWGESAPPIAGANRLTEEISLRLSSDKEWAKIISKELGVSSSDVYNSLQRAK